MSFEFKGDFESKDMHLGVINKNFVFKVADLDTS